MKKIMTAATLGLFLLSGSAVFAAQNTATSSDSTMKSTKKSHKKHKKSKTETGSTTSTTK